MPALPVCGCVCVCVCAHWLVSTGYLAVKQVQALPLALSHDRRVVSSTHMIFVLQLFFMLQFQLLLVLLVRVVQPLFLQFLALLQLQERQKEREREFELVAHANRSDRN